MKLHLIDVVKKVWFFSCTFFTACELSCNECKRKCGQKCVKKSIKSQI